MRKLDRMEKMAIRMSLRVEGEKLRGLIARSEGNAKRTYTRRFERVENLLSLFAPDITVTVGV